MVDDGPLRACVSAGHVSFVRRVSNELASSAKPDTSAADSPTESDATHCDASVSDDAAEGDDSAKCHAQEMPEIDGDASRLIDQNKEPAGVNAAFAAFQDDVDCLELEM